MLLRNFLRDDETLERTRGEVLDAVLGIVGRAADLFAAEGLGHFLDRDKEDVDLVERLQGTGRIGGGDVAGAAADCRQ